MFSLISLWNHQEVASGPCSKMRRWQAVAILSTVRESERELVIRSVPMRVLGQRLSSSSPASFLVFAHLESLDTPSDVDEGVGSDLVRSGSDYVRSSQQFLTFHNALFIFKFDVEVSVLVGLFPDRVASFEVEIFDQANLR